jgi:dienelactone hydrolase
MIPINYLKILVSIMLITSIFEPKLKAQENLYDIGQFYHEVQEYADKAPMRLSYLSADWPELEQWRTLGRAKMHELLGYYPTPAPLNPEIIEEIKKEGYTLYRLSYSITPHRRSEAFLLIPDGLTGPAPAVIALHDHGAFYYYGKEKITETENQPEILKEFIQESYGGRTFADELARRGFVVLCPDAFFFGSQRLDVGLIPERFTRNYPGLASADKSQYIRDFNRFCGPHENIIARYIFGSGTTWPGILFHGDRVSLEYLLTRPEVDPERIGVVGLSLGGFRSAHLFGLDHRIKAGVNAGWMTSYGMQVDNHFRNHTWMIYVPGQLQYLDLPDVVTLNAPRPLLIMNCRRDNLYTIGAMQSASDKISAVYEKIKAPGKFKTLWYDVPHSFNIEMQDDAIDWLEKWLKHDNN